MSTAACQIDPDRIILRPHGLAGWVTVLNHADREITMQFRILGVRLPLRRRIPYSEVVRVVLTSRALGVTRTGSRHGRREIRGSLAGLISWGREEMADRGAAHDLMVTIRGGMTLKIGPIFGATVAKDVETRFRHKLGLPEA